MVRSVVFQGVGRDLYPGKCGASALLGKLNGAKMVGGWTGRQSEDLRAEGLVDAPARCQSQCYFALKIALPVFLLAFFATVVDILASAADLSGRLRTAGAAGGDVLRHHITS